MEFISIISLGIGIILLIAFFKMASNVSAIKDMLKAQSTAHLKTAFYVHLANNDVPQATKALLSLVFADLMEKDYTERERYHLFEERRVKYEPFFKRLGCEYPANPFDSRFVTQ